MFSVENLTDFVCRSTIASSVRKSISRMTPQEHWASTTNVARKVSPCIMTHDVHIPVG